MEKESLMTAMKNSISEVLEMMFFLPIDLPDIALSEGLWGSVTGDILSARLGFSGPFSGYFIFCVPEKLAASLTAGFLGRGEDSITENHVTETVTEILNMIAGNTFSILDNQSVFDLDIPEMVSFDDIRNRQNSSDNTMVIPVNTLENPLELQMIINT